jgi:DNA end-binding protein Ku
LLRNPGFGGHLREVRIKRRLSQRERTIALRSMPGGLVAHTLDEQSDINDARSIFGDGADVKIDPEMVQLAKLLIDRQTTKYDPSDLEDRYETRLRAMIDAKLKGEGIDISEPSEPDRSNVIDLMAALKKSLGQDAAAKAPLHRRNPPSKRRPKPRRSLRHEHRASAPEPRPVTQHRRALARVGKISRASDAGAGEFDQSRR